jgi:Mn-dependent DtxR family transcriptional regulator
MMLGASRPMVTIAAGALQKSGLITYHRGHLTIVDRNKLELASCECYQAATTLLVNVTRNYQLELPAQPEAKQDRSA